MRHFHVIRDLSNGHKAGEFVSDLRLPRADIAGMLAAGDIQEIDAETVKYRQQPAVTAQPPAVPTEPRSSAAPVVPPVAAGSPVVPSTPPKKGG